MSHQTAATVAHTIGIDTGKNTLHLIGLDDQGAIVLREKIARGRIAARFAKAAIGNGAAFAKGRDFAAWLGLVPKQMSTGDRTILGRISKRGNRYLGTLLMQGARVILLRPANWAQFWPVANGRGKPAASQRVGYCPC